MSSNQHPSEFSRPARGSFPILVCAALFLATLATTSQADPTTQPITAGRDTPAGAMNVYEHALETGDLATVADSMNRHGDQRLLFAREAIAEARFVNAMEKRFGHTATASLCRECRIQLPLTGTKFTDDDWKNPPNHPDMAVGNWAPGKTTPAAPLMQRGPDGIWRIGRFLTTSERSRAASKPFAARTPSTSFVNREVTQLESRSEKLESVTSGIEAGKYTTTDAVMAGLYPEGTPMARARQAEEQQKREAQKFEDDANRALLAGHFDPSTLDGAISTFKQAMLRKDAAAAAKFYFLPHAPDDTFALATAKLALAAQDFQRAATNIDPNGPSLASTFGFNDNGSLVVLSPMLPEIPQHGDTAVIPGREGNDDDSIWFQKVGGVWKQELKLQPWQNIPDRTADMEQDAAAITRVTAGIDQGEYKTLDDVRDALGRASLSSFSDPLFNTDWRKYDVYNQQQALPALKGPPSTDRRTRAGAMNAFSRAVEAGDAVTVADSLYLPNDQGGSDATAMAHDYIQDIQFFRALEAKFPNVNTRNFSFGFSMLEPDSLHDCTDEQWSISPKSADIATGIPTYVWRSSIVNGQKSNEMQPVWTPILHRGPDGNWRLGPWYSQSSRQLDARIKILKAKDEILAQAIANLNANKYATMYDALAPLGAQLTRLGLQRSTQN